MKRKEFIGKLTYYDRLRCSCYGNPRFYGEFTSESVYLILLLLLLPVQILIEILKLNK